MGLIYFYSFFFVEIRRIIPFDFMNQMTDFRLMLTQKTWALAGSPQSTLSAVGTWSGRSTVSSNGSPNGRSRVSSPPTTPLSEKTDAWELIYAAAGQAARLKMTGDGTKYQQGRGLLGPPRSPIPVPAQQAKNANAGFYSYQTLSNSLSQANQVGYMSFFGEKTGENKGELVA